MRMTWYLLASVSVVLVLAWVTWGPAPDTQAGTVMEYGDFDLDQWVYDGKRVAAGRSDKFDKSNELVQTRGKEFLHISGICNSEIASLNATWLAALISGSRFASVKRATTGYPRISTFGSWVMSAREPCNIIPTEC